MYEFVYLKVSIVTLIIWTLIFMFRKEQRKEMLIASALGGIAGPLQELWYTKDYWHPDYIGNWPWIEDIIFGFAIVGIAAVIYETIFASRIREQNTEASHPFIAPLMFLTIAFGMGLFTPIMNSIYAAISMFILVWLICVFLRRDLLIASLGAGLFLVIFAFIGYQAVIFQFPGIIQAWWELENISGILILGIPFEEYLWFFTAGLALGPLWEFWRGIRFLPSQNKAEA